jgi:hypothetical protein
VATQLFSALLAHPSGARPGRAATQPDQRLRTHALAPDLLPRLQPLGMRHVGASFLNLPPAALVAEALNNDEGVLTDTGALRCDTGRFTQRS